MRDRGREELAPLLPRWKQIRPYALVSLVAFICATLLLLAFIWHADKIVALGLTGRLYYIVLLPFGLCVSVFLFGVLRSFGIYRGRVFGGLLELGGPVVGFLLVVILGFALPEPAQNFSLTIIAHGPLSNTDMVLRSTGSIILDTGALRRTAPIGPNGDALFPEIPANMWGRKASVGLDAEGFELAEPQKQLTLSPTTFYVEVRLKPGLLAGHVYADDQPLPGVTLSAGRTQTTTDGQGYFEMQVAGIETNSEVTLVATKTGYTAWSGLEVPNSNELSLTLHKER